MDRIFEGRFLSRSASGLDVPETRENQKAFVNLFRRCESAPSTLSQPAIFAWRNTYFSTEDLSEMAWASVTDIESYLDDAPLGLPEQTTSLLHSWMDKVLRGCEPSRLLESAAKMEFAHVRLASQAD